jgi:hypothetical protein
MKFLVGSQYFFNGIKDFAPHDIDYLELCDYLEGYNSIRITGRGKCLFKWLRMTPDKFVEVTLKNGLPMAMGKFLIPEFCKEIGFTIEHLKQLKPLVEKLDEKHKYEEVIFNAYIDNNDFVLNEEQLHKAYEVYNEKRKTT